MECRRAVEKHRVLFDDDFKSVPDLGTAFIHHLLGGFNVVGDAVFNQLFHNEWSEKLDCHFLWNAALVNLQVRSYNDNGTAGVVDTFAQQILTETSLLALEHVGQALERSGVGACDRSSAASVVDKSVDRFLKHALLIAHDDVGSVELYKSFKSVVSVYYSAVQVI